MARQQDKAIGIGEVLLDIFEDERSTVGGAPLNVTFHLNQLMQLFGVGEARFISQVGRDEQGDRIRSYLSAAEMNVDFVSTDEKLPTGTALVFTDQGQAGFEISQNVAWDAIPISRPMIEFAQKSSAVVFGSLAQRSALSRQTVRHVVSVVQGERLYDVNLRRNTRSGIAGYTDQIVRSSLELATIAKLNDEEIEQVATMLGYSTSHASGEERQWTLMSMLAAEFGLSVVALTRGFRGALILNGREKFHLKDSTLPQNQVHPVGAGDSFAAGLLFGRIQRWEMRFCLELAELMANWVVQHISATPRLTEKMKQALIELNSRAGAALMEEPVA